MTDREALNRVKSLDLRNCEPEDYAALYTVIQLAEKCVRTETGELWEKLKKDSYYD